MSAWLRKKLRFTKNQRGMTLIELTAVVVILGIVATVAGAAVVNSFGKAKTSSTASSQQVLREAAQRYVVDKDSDLSSPLTITAQQLVDGGYLSAIPSNPAGKALDHVVVTSTSGALSFTYFSDTSTPPTPW